jgi:hypothetical protein
LISMTAAASRLGNAASSGSYDGKYNGSNGVAGPSSSNISATRPPRHFYLNGDDDEDTLDEMARNRLHTMPYELGNGDVDDDADAMGGGMGYTESQEDEDDDDELSTTSGRRHGALLQPEEADLILFEVSIKPRAQVL